jgi:hypothetical protein
LTHPANLTPGDDPYLAYVAGDPEISYYFTYSGAIDIPPDPAHDVISETRKEELRGMHVNVMRQQVVEEYGIDWKDTALVMGIFMRGVYEKLDARNEERD